MEPILGKGVRNALLEWIVELQAEPELKQAGLTAQKKAMFDGPPGTGKTTLAHHLAARLKLPMLCVRPERLIDKFVGSTGRNIGALFDMVKAQKQPIVLFLDEFDAVAIQRRQAHQGAEDEQNSWVNVLLQRIEKHDGFVIAATNFPKHIDKAIWRRFDVHITLDLPGAFERERILARYLAPYGLPRRELKLLAEVFDTAAPALIRQFCESLKRRFVIGPKVGWDMRREATIDALVSKIKPHPDAGLPTLWSLGVNCDAVRAMTWPLPLAKDVKDEPEAAREPAPIVVDFPRQPKSAAPAQASGGAP